MELEDEKSFRKEFQPILEQANQLRGACPSAEVLLDFVEGRLSEEARKAITAHISLCGECQLDILNTELDTKAQEEALKNWSSVDTRLTERMQQLLRTKSKVEPSRGHSFSFPLLYRLGLKDVPRLHSLVYAITLIAIFILPLFVYRTFKLQRQLSLQEQQFVNERRTEREGRNELNKKISDLAEQIIQKESQIMAFNKRAKEAGQLYANPYSKILNLSVFRSPESQDMTTIRIPAEAELLILLLNFRALIDYKRYDVEIRETSGPLVLESKSLKKDEFQGLQLAIPKNALEPKTYVMKIHGLSNGEKTLITEHKFGIIF